MTNATPIPMHTAWAPAAYGSAGYDEWTMTLASDATRTMHKRNATRLTDATKYSRMPMLYRSDAQAAEDAERIRQMLNS